MKDLFVAEYYTETFYLAKIALYLCSVYKTTYLNPLYIEK